ncbi:MAG: hypothetical protein K0R44_3177 [Thermomicrobiales bacterium]|nr:hypothetical protein [Thermomicrobiales bacterium]
MKNRLNSGSIVRARRLLMIGVPAVGLALAVIGVAPAQQTFAQESSGGSIDIGGGISATVAGAVSDIATGSGGNTTTMGGISVEHSELEFGEVGEAQVAQQVNRAAGRRAIEGFTPAASLECDRGDPRHFHPDSHSMWVALPGG